MINASTDLRSTVEELLTSAIVSHIADLTDDSTDTLSGLDLLDIEEDAAFARFGPAVAGALADATVQIDVAVQALCCVSFDCPGEFGLFGSVDVRFPVEGSVFARFGSVDEGDLSWGRWDEVSS